MTPSTAPAWDGTRLAAPARIHPRLSRQHRRRLLRHARRTGPRRLRRQRHPISLQQGASNKDIWVLAEGPVEPVTLLNPANQAVELRRVGNNLPSRLADNFFWLGRYCERADATARLLRSLLARLSSESGPGSFPLIEPLLNTLAKQAQIAPLSGRPGIRNNPAAIEAELLEEIFDAKAPGIAQRHRRAKCKSWPCSCATGLPTICGACFPNSAMFWRRPTPPRPGWPTPAGSSTRRCSIWPPFTGWRGKT